ncbi:MAG: hypothetical protein A3J76_03695 [Candidatus Moranbacteria bacterium RBG_13_45_13]|nr:MAG: hypothetical protein A3J76_03695 [Candidatus Moranbacteria bacterium RBG_13_45_13]
MAQENQKQKGKESADPHCFACDIPLGKHSDYGTNVDGSVNEKYCCNCLKKGVFTQPKDRKFII